MRPALITFNGETLSQTAWGDRLGISGRLISKRFAKGWPVERALATDLPRYPRKLGPESPMWKGGRTVMGPDRYIGIFMPQHPRANGSGYVREHVLIAERALGKPLPASAVVHHVDEVQDNNRNNNLVICQDNTYHRLLHVRMRIAKAGGDPDRDKICGKCHAVVPRTFFSRLRRSKDGLATNCRGCNSQLMASAYASKKARNG
jgi:RNase P subunit RPR2